MLPGGWQVKVDFRDSLFDGAELDLTAGGPGYKCSNNTLNRVCFGRTGEQVRGHNGTTVVRDVCLHRSMVGGSCSCNFDWFVCNQPF